MVEPAASCFLSKLRNSRPLAHASERVGFGSPAFHMRSIPNMESRTMGNELTQSELKRLFKYDPENGVFTRLVKVGRHDVGAVAGTIDDDGYVRITINRKKYRAQRLAFLYMTGAFPENEVDHEDRVRTNNAWRNLREATTQQNAANRAATASSGYKGVSCRNGRYVAIVKYDGKKRYLGSFGSAEAAHAAYTEAANDLYGDFARSA